MHPRVFLTALALVVAAAGCASHSKPAVSASEPRAATGCSPGTRLVQLTPGTPRVRIHVPPGLTAGRRYPLVIGLHAAGQDGAAFEQDTGLSQAGDRDRFVTAYPTSWRSRFFWSYPERDHPRSGRRLIAATIRAAVALGCVDPRRVVVTGRSSGGRMTESAGCGLADRLLAIFPVSAGTKRLPACPNARPVSVIDFHGTADPIAPYRTVMHAMRGWARRDGCDAQAVRTRIEKDTLRFEWRHCARGVRVVHYRLLGAEHNWPPLSSAFTSDVDATREIVRWLGRLQG